MKGYKETPYSNVHCHCQPSSIAKTSLKKLDYSRTVRYVAAVLEYKVRQMICTSLNAHLCDLASAVLYGLTVLKGSFRSAQGLAPCELRSLLMTFNSCSSLEVQ